MKVILRLPTTDQYAYLETEIEVMSIEDGLAEYHRAMRLIKGGTGLDEKEYNAFIDNQLMGNDKNHIDQYEKMTTEQKAVVQVLKRALKRIKSKAE